MLTAVRLTSFPPPRLVAFVTCFTVFWFYVYICESRYFQVRQVVLCVLVCLLLGMHAGGVDLRGRTVESCWR